MVNISVVAKPYAKAAFEFANENNLLQQWSNLLQKFTELISDDYIVNIISSHVLSQMEFVDIIKDCFDENFFNFIALIAENKKLAIISEIANQFKVIKNVHTNIKHADVTLVFTADQDLLNSMKANLEKRFNCSINMNIKIDPTIVGGAIIKVDGTVIDNSVSGRLEKLKKILLS